MKQVASWVQAAGLVALSVAGFTVDATWGFLALGGSLVLYGVAMERS